MFRPSVQAENTLANFVKRTTKLQLLARIGIGHLYTRDATGKFRKIRSQAEVDRLLTEGREGKHYWIFTKDPSAQAFNQL